jgi:hypothetical protein
MQQMELFPELPPTLTKEEEDELERMIGYSMLNKGINGTSALDVQVAGNHYKKLKIQPVEYIHGNGIPFIEGCIIKYASRWRDKGGIKDLEKIKHFVDLLIELETRNGTNT